MNSHPDTPFETIESAHDFVKLLTKAVCEAKRELEAYMETESGSDVPRRLDALRIALYSLGKLENHMSQSGRILNDLRTLRRLLLAERGINRKTIPSNLQSATDENASPERIEAQLTLGRLLV